jgi:hypothetical protein
MKLTIEEKLCLEELYLHYAIPTDQLRRTPAVLTRITSAFCNMTGRTVSPEELLRYMINRRKNRDWPTLGERAHRFAAALKSLTEYEVGVLKEIYVALDITSDEILLRASFAKDLVAAFARRVGRIVPSHVLVPGLLQLRKRGLLPTLCDDMEGQTKRKQVAEGFEDIHEVAKKYRAGGR